MWGIVVLFLAFLHRRDADKSTERLCEGGRGLQNIASAESVRRFSKISGSLERMSAGLEIVELVNASIHGEDQNEELFDAIVSALDALNNPQTEPSLISLWFMNRLADVLGYRVRTEGCGVCDEEAGLIAEKGAAYSIAFGAPLAGARRCCRYGAGRPVVCCSAGNTMPLDVEAVKPASSSARVRRAPVSATWWTPGGRDGTGCLAKPANLLSTFRRGRVLAFGITPHRRATATAGWIHGGGSGNAGWRGRAG